MRGVHMSLRIFSQFTTLLLEAEVAPSSEGEFVQKYSVATGSIPTSHPSYQSQDNKWGIECRMYFNAPDGVVESIERLGHHVERRSGEGYRPEYDFRINSERLFWQLIEYGYRLGENEPIPFRGN